MTPLDFVLRALEDLVCVDLWVPVGWKASSVGLEAAVASRSLQRSDISGGGAGR